MKKRFRSKLQISIMYRKKILVLFRVLQKRLSRVFHYKRSSLVEANGEKRDRRRFLAVNKFIVESELSPESVTKFYRDVLKTAIKFYP